MRTEHLKILINQWSIDMLADLVTAMKNSGSRELYNKAEYKGLKEDIDLIVAEINLPIGAYYMSEGRAAGGNFPPLTDIKKWITLHNIQPAESKFGKAHKILSPNAMDSMAYAIGKKIMDFGTKASAKHFLENFKLTSEWNQKAIVAYRDDVKQSLQDIADRLNAP
jgi:hypothetical protein